MSRPRVLVTEEIDPVFIGTMESPTKVVSTPRVSIAVEFDYGDEVEAVDHLHVAYERAVEQLRSLSRDPQ